MDVAEMTPKERSEALVGLALAEHVDAANREAEKAKEAELGRQIKVADAARITARATFGEAAAELLEWTVSPVDPEEWQIAEAAVKLFTTPHPVLLVFRTRAYDDREDMASIGAFFVRRECYRGACDGGVGHVTRVKSLADIGAVLTQHASYDLDERHSPPVLPAEWSEMPVLGR